MRMSNNALRIAAPTAPPIHELTQPNGAASQPVPTNGQPRLVQPADGNNGNGHHKEQPLRMYTEEQVADMLQVSLSQLRKWRMKQFEGYREWTALSQDRSPGPISGGSVAGLYQRRTANLTSRCVPFSEIRETAGIHGYLPAKTRLVDENRACSVSNLSTTMWKLVEEMTLPKVGTRPPSTLRIAQCEPEAKDLPLSGAGAALPRHRFPECGRRWRPRAP